MKRAKERGEVLMGEGASIGKLLHGFESIVVLGVIRRVEGADIGTFEVT